MQSNTHIILNVQAPNVAVVVNAKQGDKLSRVITADLVDGDLPFIPPTGVAAVVRYFKPDNTIGFYDVTEDGSAAVTMDGSEATITLAEQALTVPGNVCAEINFYTATEKLTTFSFIIHVQKSAVSDQEIESTDYFSVLTQKINALLGASTNPPYINATTKNWMIWSEASGEYVDSGFSSIGLVPPSNVTYQAGNSGTTPPSGTWTATIPTVPQGGYLWTRTQFEFSNGTQQMSYSVARQGVDGSGSVSSVFGVGPDASGNVNPAPFSGLVKSNGTNLSEAVPGTDYQEPLGFNPGMVNPNLLDNWYFVGGGSQQGNGQFPINQIGELSIQSKGYLVDRWIGYSQGGSVSVAEEGIKISSDGTNTAGFLQRIPAPALAPGLTYTLSALVQLLEDENDTDNHNIAFSYGISSDANTETKWIPNTTDLSNFNVISWTFVLPESSDGEYNFRIRSMALAPISYIIKAIKLELGDKQTIAHKDSSGNWVLNEIPDYGDQLARCQRYYVSFKSYMTAGHITSAAKNYHMYIYTPVPMRALPTVTLESYNARISTGYSARTGNAYVSPQSLVVAQGGSSVGSSFVDIYDTVTDAVDANNIIINYAITNLVLNANL